MKQNNVTSIKGVGSRGEYPFLWCVPGVNEGGTSIAVKIFSDEGPRYIPTGLYPDFDLRSSVRGEYREITPDEHDIERMELLHEIFMYGVDEIKTDKMVDRMKQIFSVLAAARFGSPDKFRALSSDNVTPLNPGGVCEPGDYELQVTGGTAVFVALEDRGTEMFGVLLGINPWSGTVPKTDLVKPGPYLSAYMKNCRGVE